MKLLTGRVQRFLLFLRRRRAGDFRHVPDPRKGKVTHPWTRIWECLTTGLVLNLRTLRDVEELSAPMFGGRISDTTFDQALRTAADGPL